jgi:hypothetical protein
MLPREMEVLKEKEQISISGRIAGRRKVEDPLRFRSSPSALNLFHAQGNDSFSNIFLKGQTLIENLQILIAISPKCIREKEW